MATQNITENHRIVTMEHELRIEGHYLCEKKQKSVIEPMDSDDNVQTQIMVHVRVIDDSFYKVTETKRSDEDQPVQVIETEMSEDEIKAFEELWTKLWDPKITEKEMLELE